MPLSGLMISINGYPRKNKLKPEKRKQRERIGLKRLKKER